MKREQILEMEAIAGHASLLGKRPVGSGRRYLFEYFILLVLFALSYTTSLVHGHHMEVVMIKGNLRNPELNHTYQGSTVPISDLVIGAVAAFLLLLLYRALDPQKRWFGIHAMVREILWSYVLASLITNCAKNYVGRPRPNFYEMCKYDGTGCTVDVADAFRSFPSGHSSSAMSTFGLICIHFSENVLLQLRGHKVPWERLDTSEYGWLWNLFLRLTTTIGSPAIIVALIPGLFAFFVICSRIHDYWHFAGDALAGGAIGLGCALLSFSMFRRNLYLDSSSPPTRYVEETEIASG